ncbi:MAG: sugar ABC transporter permease [Anaerolineae bacterium]|uniref:carbohydrate ABC transporter permease n=1 Tax=Candidatus Amarolinea dominans TaxID=3140696 RepID=UPI003136D5C5|nr:sugar ABC transporter permease [Anaerolineae bacterium]
MNILTKPKPAAPAKRPLTPGQRREINWGLIFLSPWIVGFLIFTAIPMVVSLVMSFTNYNPIQADATRFVAFQNYGRIFDDPQVFNAVGVTLRFVLISVPLSIILPLGLALLVNAKQLLGKNVFRTLFAMPYMIPVVAGVMVWGGILNSDSGWLNRFLQWAFGVCKARNGCKTKIGF